MSAPLKSFEGPDVEVLLDQIRADVGPGAKINGAEKIRVGGVLGFFAKEHYRVVVEGPQTLGNRADTGTRTPTDVFSAMADATDDVNDVGAGSSVASSPMAEIAEPPVPETAVASLAVAAPEPDTAPITESFDAVLTRVATTLDATPLADATGNGNGSGQGAGTAVAYPPETESAGHDDLAAHDDTAASNDTAASDDTVTPVGMAPVAPLDIATKAALFLNGIAPTPVAGSPDDAMAAALRRVGLDPALVALVGEGLAAGGGLETLLVEALATLAPAPAVPVCPGSLLVVVGAGAPARRLGAALADEIGIDPARIPLASLDAGAYALATGTLLVRSAEEAAERAPGWRRSEAAVVVVDAGVTDRGRSWALHMIAALRPTAVWGVVDSTSKTEDIAAWAEALGGLHALALENTDATVSPAAVLGAGIAVARINGQPATAARWAATIVDRVRPCR